MGLVVLAWPSVSPPDDNPYVNLLYDALVDADDLIVVNFTWRRAMTSRFDVLHLHWPDWTLRDSSISRSLLKLAGLTVILVRARLLRRGVTWTVHNLRPHNFSGPRRERYLYRLLKKFVSLQIHLTSATELEMAKTRHPAVGTPHTVIPHGLYPTSVAARLARRSNETQTAEKPPIVAFIGTVSEYKGVTSLIEAVTSITRPVSLIIAGEPSSPSYAGKLKEMAQSLPNVRLDFRRFPEKELLDVVCMADLVVLPFIAGLNSGSAMLALGAGTPILVPSTPTFTALAKEFPPPWITTFDESLTAQELTAALDAISSSVLSFPILNNWEWDEIASFTAAALRKSLQTARRR
jgi:beta-1,4-mannosyltransferase